MEDFSWPESQIKNKYVHINKLLFAETNSSILIYENYQGQIQIHTYLFKHFIQARNFINIKKTK